jgi:hypothetical protein
LSPRGELDLTVAAILAASPGQPQAQEPEVTEDDRRLHGDLAGVVHLLREASTATRDAHALACKHRRDHRVLQDDGVNKVQIQALDQAVEDTWKAKAEAWIAYQDVAAVPPALFRR